MSLITTITDGNWDDSTIWDSGTIPVKGDNVEILHNVLLNTDFECGDDTTTAALIIKDTGELRWDGNSNIQGIFWGDFKADSGSSISFINDITADNKLKLYCNASDSPGLEKYNIDFQTSDTIFKGFNSIEYIWSNFFITDTNKISVDINRVQDWKIGDLVVFDSRKKRRITNIDLVNGIITLDTAVTTNGFITNAERNIQILEYTSGYGFKITTQENHFKYTMIVDNLNRSHKIFQQYNFSDCEGFSFVGEAAFGQKYQGTGTNINKFSFFLKSYNSPSTFFASIYGYFKNSSVIGGLSYNVMINSLTDNILDNIAFGYHDFKLRQFGVSEIVFQNCTIINMKAITGDEHSYVPYKIKDCKVDGSKFFITALYNTITGTTFGEFIAKTTYLRTGIVYRLFLVRNANNRDMIEGVALNENAELMIYDDNYSNFFYYYLSGANSLTEDHNGNGIATITSNRNGLGNIHLQSLVEKNTAYNFKIDIKRLTTVDTLPIFKLVKNGEILLTTQSVNPTDWETLSIKWNSDFNGFVDLYLEFNYSEANEIFKLSDEFNSFTYWSKGKIIPIYPKTAQDQYSIARTVWDTSPEKLNNLDVAVSTRLPSNDSRLDKILSKVKLIFFTK